MCVCVCVCVVRQSAREAFETKHSNWNCWLTVSWGDSFGRRGTQISVTLLGCSTTVSVSFSLLASLAVVVQSSVGVILLFGIRYISV
jgi:hypothetical protein